MSSKQQLRCRILGNRTTILDQLPRFHMNESRIVFGSWATPHILLIIQLTNNTASQIPPKSGNPPSATHISLPNIIPGPPSEPATPPRTMQPLNPVHQKINLSLHLPLYITQVPPTHIDLAGPTMEQTPPKPTPSKRHTSPPSPPPTPPRPPPPKSHSSVPFP